MNSPKTLPVRSLLLAIIGGVVFVPALIRYYSLRPIQSDSAALGAYTSALTNSEEVKPEKVRYGAPVRLIIPVLKVNAPIDRVGLLSNGDMEAPGSNESVGWYRFGPNPGDTGSAVIAGHYGRWGKAVFGKLDSLKKGDRLQIEDENGEMVTFLVRESRIYDPEADTSEIFAQNDGRSHLNLITCEGVWDAASKTYSERLVVFTDMQ
jgi:LPXTG-site transpeptidase (sortase) family protein